MEAEALINDLIKKERDLSRIIEELRDEIKKIADSLPTLRSSWSRTHLEPGPGSTFARAGENELHALRARERTALRDLQTVHIREADAVRALEELRTEAANSDSRSVITNT